MTEREGQERPPGSEDEGSRSGEPPPLPTQASAPEDASGDGRASEEASAAEEARPRAARQYVVTAVDLGKFAVAAVTVIASLTGLILGIRAEHLASRADERAGREEQRVSREEQRLRDQREKAYTERVDFYRMGSEVIVVNGSSRPMTMRLSLPASRVWWDLDLLRPCKQIFIPNEVLLQSMAQEQPSLKLAEADLAQLRLEFIDPDERAWIRGSGGVVARMEKWTPAVREGLVSSEAWNLRPEPSPQCDAPVT
ncbi:hypothetical protein [Streptomyces sp. NPDC048357]|uniref:hypothetical protein n=1 Tax=Streptomyces sp. NPDC048357 TaxID=3154719 RepID=UPI0034208035